MLDSMVSIFRFEKLAIFAYAKLIERMCFLGEVYFRNLSNVLLVSNAGNSITSANNPMLVSLTTAKFRNGCPEERRRDGKGISEKWRRLSGKKHWSVHIIYRRKKQNYSKGALKTFVPVYKMAVVETARSGTVSPKTQDLLP